MTCFVWTSVVICLLGIISGVVVVLYKNEIITRRPLFKFFQYVTDLSMDKDFCLIPYPKNVWSCFGHP